MPDRTVLLDRHTSAVGDPIDPAEVTAFDALSFQTSWSTTTSNRRWLEELASRGMSGAWFHGIPHVLAAGQVPLSEAVVVDWAQPPAR